MRCSAQARLQQTLDAWVADGGAGGPFALRLCPPSEDRITITTEASTIAFVQYCTPSYACACTLLVLHRRFVSRRPPCTLPDAVWHVSRDTHAWLNPEACHCPVRAQAEVTYQVPLSSAGVDAYSSVCGQASSQQVGSALLSRPGDAACQIVQLTTPSDVSRLRISQGHAAACFHCACPWQEQAVGYVCRQACYIYSRYIAQGQTLHLSCARPWCWLQVRGAVAPPPPGAAPPPPSNGTDWLPLIIAAVVVGAALGACCCCLLLFLLWRRRRPKKEEQEPYIACQVSLLGSDPQPWPP